MINVGALRDKVLILTFEPVLGGFDFLTSRSFWTKAVYTGKNVIYSKLAATKKEMRFICRKQSFEKDCLFLFEDKKYLICDIRPATGSMGYYEIVCGKMEPIHCMVTKTSTSLDPIFHRPVLNKDEAIFFKGFMSEKYVNAAHESPNESIESLFILTVSKKVLLNVGELVQIGDKVYVIQTAHAEDAYISYEIFRKEDV